MKKGCIFVIAIRKNLLEKTVSDLNKYYNSKYKYPFLVFYHGNTFDDVHYRAKLRFNNPQFPISFHKIGYKIPDQLGEKDLFWNQSNDYARSFGKGRVGYLHANYFWNNFMNYGELSNYDYLHRIDDDSWFKKDIPFDLFEELDNRNGYFGSALTWNHFNQNHLDVRENLFEWIKYYVEKYNVNVKSEQLRESLKGPTDNEKFHTLRWSAGNCNIYNRKMFEMPEWKQYNKEYNDSCGGYRYRWADQEIIGLFAYMHLDNPIVDFNLKEMGIYQGKNPEATIPGSKVYLG